MDQLSKRQAYDRQWYHDNKERLRKSKAKSARELRARRLEWLKQIKDQPCKDCGKKFPHYVMEFDHCRGRKRFEIGTSFASRSIEELLKEIENCDLLCANCHRIRTFTRMAL